MKRRLSLAILITVLALPLQAGPAEDSIVRQLRDQGFRNIEIERTLLGRSRITAKSRRLEREIILNPATGEILRDYWEERNGKSAGSGIIKPSPGGTKSGRDNDDDDRNDDRDDDRAEDNSGRGNASDRGDDGDDGDDGDNSGSGSGNSGSGSGNSGHGGDDGDGDGDGDD